MAVKILDPILVRCVILVSFVGVCGCVWVCRCVGVGVGGEVEMQQAGCP